MLSVKYAALHKIASTILTAISIILVNLTVPLKQRRLFANI